jgi:hypothetical protein
MRLRRILVRGIHTYREPAFRDREVPVVKGWTMSELDELRESRKVEPIEAVPLSGVVGPVVRRRGRAVEVWSKVTRWFGFT